MIWQITLLLFLFFAVIGVPLYLVMGGIGLVLFLNEGIELSAVAIEMYRVASSPTLVTIPLFTLAGFMLAESKTPQRLINVATAFVGNIRGGIAIVALLVCSFFTAFTGASGVTIIAMGGLLFPILINQKYKENFTLGLITSSGSLGLLFPPSLPLILYGIVGKVDINLLFKAAIAPGIFLVLVLSLWSRFNSPTAIANEKKLDSIVVSKIQALKDARYELPIPFIILGGIYGGLFTTSEAATITVIYVFIMEFFLYKDLSLKKDFTRIISEAMTLVGAILIILCCAMGLTNFLIDQEVPMKILDLMKHLITNKYVFLLCLNIFLLIVGCLMDIFSAIIVVLPLIIPMAAQYDIHPIHLAIIFLTNLEIGYITPPVGINLFLSSYRFNKPMVEIYKASIPFLLILIAALMVITYVPILSTFLVY